MSNLLPKYAVSSFYHIFAENAIAEHKARAESYDVILKIIPQVR